MLFVFVSLSGCLGDDIWREPFLWRNVADEGESQDAAEALAAGMASLGDQMGTQGDAAIGTVDALPDSVAFQNMREFFNTVQNGSGDQFHDGVEVVVDNATGGAVLLTGGIADAYASATGPLMGTPAPFKFNVAERATAVRWTLDVLLTGQESPEPGQNPTPVGVVFVRLIDPNGAVRADYKVDTSRQILDMVVEGTFGGRNDVRSHLGGEWTLEVDANAEGAWSLVVDAHEPRYDDWDFYEFWRADKREVTGE